MSSRHFSISSRVHQSRNYQSTQSTQLTINMTCGKFHMQSCGFFWFLTPAYLVHCALIGSKCSSDAVFNLIIHRPRIAGGTLTIPIDSSVRLVKCFRKEAPYNTIRIRYGKIRKCLVMRASDALEREKWLVGLIQAMAAAQSLNEHMPTSTVLHISPEIEPKTASKPAEEQRTRTQAATAYPSPTQSSIDTISSSADRLDNDFIPVLQYPLSDTANDVAPIDMVDRHSSTDDQGITSCKGHFQRRRARKHLSVATQFLTTIGKGLATS